MGEPWVRLWVTFQPGFYPFDLFFVAVESQTSQFENWIYKLIRIVSSPSFMSPDNVNCRDNRINQVGWIGSA